MVATLTNTTITLVAVSWFELFDTQEIKFEIANLKKDILWLRYNERNETPFFFQTGCRWLLVSPKRPPLLLQLLGTPPLSLTHFTVFIFNLYLDDHFWICHALLKWLIIRIDSNEVVMLVAILVKWRQTSRQLSELWMPGSCFCLPRIDPQIIFIHYHSSERVVHAFICFEYVFVTHHFQLLKECAAPWPVIGTKRRKPLAWNLMLTSC